METHTTCGLCQAADQLKGAMRLRNQQFTEGAISPGSGWVLASPWRLGMGTKVVLTPHVAGPPILAGLMAMAANSGLGYSGPPNRVLIRLQVAD